jgi:hypothetical protein
VELNARAGAAVGGGSTWGGGKHGFACMNAGGRGPPPESIAPAVGCFYGRLTILLLFNSADASTGHAELPC